MGFLLFGMAGLVLVRMMTGRVPTLERTRTIDPETALVTFADVAGVDEAKDEVSEIVEFLKDRRALPPSAAAFHAASCSSPPGHGTLLARSMAGEAGVPFISASGSDFVEMRRRRCGACDGCSAMHVATSSHHLHRRARCGWPQSRRDVLSHEEREQTLNQLLVEMDGFTQSESTIVVAATNRPDILDPALRPGRFDRQVTVGNPDLRGREQILRVHSRKVALEPDVVLPCARHARLSGADLANIVNEAALIAARSGTHRGWCE